MFRYSFVLFAVSVMVALSGVSAQLCSPQDSFWTQDAHCGSCEMYGLTNNYKFNGQLYKTAYLQSSCRAKAGDRWTCVCDLTPESCKYLTTIDPPMDIGLKPTGGMHHLCAAQSDAKVEKLLHEFPAYGDVPLCTDASVRVSEGYRDINCFRWPASSTLRLAPGPNKPQPQTPAKALLQINGQHQFTTNAPRKTRAPKRSAAAGVPASASAGVSASAGMTHQPSASAGMTHLPSASSAPAGVSASAGITHMPSASAGMTFPPNASAGPTSASDSTPKKRCAGLNHKQQHDRSIVTQPQFNLCGSFMKRTQIKKKLGKNIKARAIRSAKKGAF